MFDKQLWKFILIGALVALFQSLLLALMLFSGCVATSMKPDMAVDQPDFEDMNVSANDSSDSSNMSGGNLPLGFYQLGCQWDACEPPPSMGSERSNPVR